MSDEVRAEIIKAIAFGCPNATIKDNTGATAEEIEEIRRVCAAEIEDKKAWYARRYGGGSL